MLHEADARIRIEPGDITRMRVDAIVNAANERLAPGGGVCGAIHRAAGSRLAAECASIGGCPTGEARITEGYDLPAPFVIHAVGPVWRGGMRDEDALLASCYTHSLDLALSRSLRSMAFPAISTGIYGFPIDRATRIAVRTVRTWLSARPGFQEVVFSVYGSEVEAAYRRELAS
jgi:O-acetyl-ADP-ribose deacetylase (regulator of RNase III)